MKEIKHSAWEGIHFETFHRRATEKYIEIGWLCLSKYLVSQTHLKVLNILWTSSTKLSELVGAASTQLSDTLESLNSTETLPKIISTRGSPAPQLEIIFKIKKNNQERRLSC